MAEAISEAPQVNQEEQEENFDTLFEEENESQLHEIDEKKADLNTHQRVKSQLCGTIVELDKGFAKTSLQTTKEMVTDELGLIHSGFIFGAADYAAAAAVNEENVVMINSRVKFLAPAKVDDFIFFDAKAKFEDSRKREIKVIGRINGIKIFEGIFHAVVMEQHILKTNIRTLKKANS